MKNKTNLKSKDNIKSNKKSYGKKGKNWDKYENYPDTGKEYTNHPEWYNGDPQLVEDVARISFLAPLGKPFENTAALMGTVPGYTFDSGDYAVPGIMSIRYYTALGNLQGINRSIIQVAADQIYAWIRHANSGSRNYMSSDYLQYLLAMDGPLQLISLGMRAYGLMMQYSAQNFYYLKPLIHACGFDYQDMVENMPQLRYGINAAIARFNSFYVPSVMPLFSRHVWMCSNVFTDSTTAKHQLYVMKPNTIYEYKFAFGPTNVGGLQALSVFENADQTTSVSKYLENLNRLLDNLFEMEDVGIMSGDTRKAYDESQLIRLQQMPIDYTISPAYDEDVLNQITNATLVGAVDKDSLGVYQDATGQLRYIGNGEFINGVPVTDVNPSTPFVSIFQNVDDLESIQYPSDNTVILNSSRDAAPSPDQVMSMSRLVTIRDSGTIDPHVNKGVRYCLTFGTEIAQDAVVYTLMRKPDGTMDFQVAGLSDGTFNPLFEMVETTGGSSDFRFVGENRKFGLRLLAAFRYAPGARQVYYQYFRNSNTNKLRLRVTVLNWTQQWNNYTTLDYAVLDRLHYVALQSLFGVPFIGKSRTVKV